MKNQADKTELQVKRARTKEKRSNVTHFLTLSEKLEAVAAEAQRQLSLHRNCGCDDHAHHHRVEGVGVGGNGGGGGGVGGVGGQAGVDRRKNRPKTASSPTQTEQVSSLMGHSLTMLTKS